MKDDDVFANQVEDTLGAAAAKLKTLSFEEAASLAEITSEERMIGRYKCVVTTFRQKIENNRHLVAVQVARRRLFGFSSQHWERGVIYAPQETPREATAEELENHGG